MWLENVINLHAILTVGGLFSRFLTGEKNIIFLPSIEKDGRKKYFFSPVFFLTGEK
tara:strand:+ start:47 stop:214 length:168 start_codon:yes stop_codon:yes gene_type:complete